MLISVHRLAGRLLDLAVAQSLGCQFGAPQPCGDGYIVPRSIIGVQTLGVATYFDGKWQGFTENHKDAGSPKLLFDLLIPQDVLKTGMRDNRQWVVVLEGPTVWENPHYTHYGTLRTEGATIMEAMLRMYLLVQGGDHVEIRDDLIGLPQLTPTPEAPVK